MKINHSFQINYLFFNFYLRKIVLQEVGGKSFIRENRFEMSGLFSSLLIFTIIKTILSTFFLLFLNFPKSCKMSVDRDRVECSRNDNSG